MVEKLVKEKSCPLCGRETKLTFHHLIPKKMHRRTFFRKHFTKAQLNAGIYICRQCHSGIHKTYDEMTLAKQFYNQSLLQRDEVLQRHFQWVSKQRVAY